MEKMEKILIGKVTSAVGLKGEVKVYNYSDSTDAYENAPALILGDEMRALESLRMQKNMLVIRFEGIDTREAAEKLRGTEVFMREEDLPPLPEGEFYVRDLLGMEVVLEDGSILGTVKDVNQNGPQDLLEVERSGGAPEEEEEAGGAPDRSGRKPLLIPKVDPIVLKIDGDARRITVRLPEGLLEL